MTMAALTCSGVAVRHPHADADAVRGCSLSIGRGEKVGLLGLNGSGKTSLLHALCGFLPFAGAITVDGILLGKETLPQVRERIGMLFSVPDAQLLLPTVEEDVAWGLRIRGMSADRARERATELLVRLGIFHRCRSSPQELSQGERLRVALAGVFATEPSLALLDEPSAFLDPPGRRVLAAFLREQRGAHLLASHDLEFCRRSCDRWLLVRNGAIAAETTEPGLLEEWMKAGGLAERGEGGGRGESAAPRADRPAATS
jgi:cobalt/nickel transport system ATP-binding protein